MFQAFIGIVDCDGLVSFLREGSVPINRLALRAAAERSRRAVCYRAVVREEAAQEVRSELARKRRVEALSTLHGLAVELIAFTSPDSGPVPFTCAD
jgi:hypothetical protein